MATTPTDAQGAAPALTPQADPASGVTITPDAATVIDLSVVSGDIEITSTGLVIGGTASRAAISAVYSYTGGTALETKLNTKGYVFTGSSTNKTILIDPVNKPTTTITLSGVTMRQTGYKSAIVTTRADTTIVLQHDTSNTISSSGVESNAFCIEKNGTDGKLTIKTDDGGNTGSLSVSASAAHAGCIGSLVTDLTKGAKSPSASPDCSFTNFYFESGTLTARAGNSHNPGIGAGCRYFGKDLNGKETNGIHISGGVLDVTGGACCAGIGSGAGVPVNGIEISGGAQVTARGGTCSPGIGSGGTDHWFIGADYSIKNITVTGGTTHVWAYGDSGTKIPGIGCGKDTLGRWVETRTITKVTASPIQPKWQGYCKYGTSATNYSFSTANPKTPFGADGDIGSYLADQASKGINVYYTEIYFGPYKDNNYVGTKAELGVNDTTHMTGGSAWTVNNIKDLMLPTGHDSSGATLAHSDFTVDAAQFATINAAKTSEKVGDFPLTYTYVDAKEGKITVIGYVHLRDVGESASGSLPAVAADNAVHKTGGDAFTPDEVKSLTKLVGSASDGIHLSYGDITVDADGFAALNAAKTAGKTGDFPITYTYVDPVTKDSVSCSVTVTLTTSGTETTATDEPQAGSEDTTHATGGEAWTSDELRTICSVVGRDSSGNIVTSSMTADAAQLKAVNDAKTAGKTGTFSLTYGFSDSAGKKVATTSIVTLTGQAITKSADKRFAKNGEEVTYTLSYVNNGTVAGTGYWLKDYIPAGTEYVSCTGGGVYGTTVGGKGCVSWFFDSIASSGTKTVTFTVKVSDETVANTTVSNSAIGQMTGTTTQPGDMVNTDPSGDTSNTVTFVSTVDPKASSSDYSTTTGGDALTGDALRTLCKVSGADSLGNNVTSKLIPDANQLKAVNDAKIAHQTGTFPLTYSYVDTTGKTVTTTCNVTLTGETDLHIALTSDKTTADPGEDVAYTVNVMNKGDITSESGQVTFTIPEGMTVKDLDGGTLSADGKSIVYTLDPLAYGGGSQQFHPVLTTSTTAVYGATYTNAATITKVGGDTISIVSDPATVSVPAEELPAVVKTVSSGIAAPGDQITYTLTFANTTKATLVGYWVKDYIPANTTYITSDATTTGTNSDGAMFASWFFPSIASGETETMTLKVEVNDYEGGIKIDNVALSELTELPTPPANAATTDPAGGSSNTVTTTVTAEIAPSSQGVLPGTGDGIVMPLLICLAVGGLAIALIGLRRSRHSSGLHAKK